jgi:outer membrane beta-barrel protein
MLFGFFNESTVVEVQRSWGLLTAALLVGAHGIALAQPAPKTTAAADADNPTRPSDAPLPSCLDQTMRDQLGAELKPRGVQKRDFAKNKKVVVNPRAGLYAGDLTSSSWIAGGSVGFFFTEDLGFEGSFDLTPMKLDLDSPLAEFFQDTRFEPGNAYIVLGNFVWSPVHAKLKMGGGIVHADVLLYAGGGRMIHDAVQGYALDGGAALDLFVTKFMTIRLDVRDLMAVQEIAGETHYTNNIITTAGIAFWIPTGL